MKNLCVLITGANRGYGNAIANFILPNLDESCAMIVHSRESCVELTSSKCKVIEVVGDLSDDSVAQKIEKMNLNDFTEGWLIHNAGSPGDCSKPLLQQNLSAEQVEVSIVT